MVISVSEESEVKGDLSVKNTNCKIKSFFFFFFKDYYFWGFLVNSLCRQTGNRVRERGTTWQMTRAGTEPGSPKHMEYTPPGFLQIKFFFVFILK